MFDPDAIVLRIYRAPTGQRGGCLSAGREEVVGRAEWREARRRVRIGANRGLRNSQFRYGIGQSSGSEKRR